MSQLRNKPIDRRRLNAKDRLDYNRSCYPKAVAASRRVKRFAGQRMAQQNMRPNTTDQFARSGDYLGDFKPGIQTQWNRQRKQGADQRRAESFRPTTISIDKT